jgi:hypothetical protein
MAGLVILELFENLKFSQAKHGLAEFRLNLPAKRSLADN